MHITIYLFISNKSVLLGYLIVPIFRTVKLSKGAFVLEVFSLYEKENRKATCDLCEAKTCIVT